MIIPICPKCGRPMALYVYYGYYAHGNPIVGWQCGFDNFDTLMGYKVIVTDGTLCRDS